MAVTPPHGFPPQLVFPFALIRYDSATGQPVRNAQGHCIATRAGGCWV